MPLIFQKTAAQALERTFMQPVAGDAKKGIAEAMAETVARAGDQLSLQGETKAAGRLNKAAGKEVAEVFAENGQRANLEQAVKAWSRTHAKPPTEAQFRAFVQGRDTGVVQDFVTPIVSYRPRNPALVPDATEAKALTKRWETNRPAMEKALKTMPTKDREAYLNVQKAMGTRIDGKVALQELLLDGKLQMGSAGLNTNSRTLQAQMRTAGRPNTLAAEKKSDPRRNLIQALADIADPKSKLDSGIADRRQAFLAELTQELADPVSVSQHYKGTCAATSRGQILFSLKNPTDYTDFVHDLARPKGEAELPSGKKVFRPDDWDAGNDKAPNRHGLPGMSTNPGRTISSQLTEPVFMQVGYGTQYRYSNTFDAGFQWNSPKKVMDGGLWGEQEAKVLESINPGSKFAVVYHDKAMVKESFKAVPKSHWEGQRVVMSKEQTLNSVLSSASIDNPIPVGVNYELSGGHAILVTGAVHVKVPAGEGKPARTEQWIEYINPWGQREVQRRDAFMLVMDGATLGGSAGGVVGV